MFHYWNGARTDTCQTTARASPAMSKQDPVIMPIAIINRFRCCTYFDKIIFFSTNRKFKFKYSRFFYKKQSLAGKKIYFFYYACSGLFYCRAMIFSPSVASVKPCHFSFGCRGQNQSRIKAPMKLSGSPKAKLLERGRSVISNWL